VFGLTFGFLPGVALYNGAVGTEGNAVFSDDPLLTGPASGLLTLTFDVPTTLLQFDVVLQSIVPIGDSSDSPDSGPAYTVSLSTGSVFNEAAAPQPNGLYSEDQFSYQGAPITSATVSFFDGQDTSGNTVGAFGLDNLTFNTAEPGTMFLIGLGCVVMGLAGNRRRRHSLKTRSIRDGNDPVGTVRTVAPIPAGSFPA
jgi:hypothetical protein